MWFKKYENMGLRELIIRFDVSAKVYGWLAKYLESRGFK